jgi:hypothetical protein
MKRRTFLLTTAVATLAVISVPVVKYYSKKTYDPLVMPDELSHFCDEKTIHEIGVGYRNLVPLENEKRKLTELLLTDYDGKLTVASNKSKVIELLDKKIHEDFLGSKIQVLSGWVISVTEARQCALFSLI